MRTCGECRECCIHLEIETLKKPAMVPCHNLCKIGCGIYKDRPQVCRDFSCAWLLGQMGPMGKPCKTKTLVWAAYLNDVLTVFGSGKDKKTIKWLMKESFKFPVVLNHELYVKGERCDESS